MNTGLLAFDLIDGLLIMIVRKSPHLQTGFIILCPFPIKLFIHLIRCSAYNIPLEVQMILAIDRGAQTVDMSVLATWKPSLT
jgi:hypothetical protein